MEPPGTGRALAAGWRAAASSAWLAPVGLLVALARGALALPASLLAWVVLVRGAMAGVARDGPFPEAVLSGALEALAAPRRLAVLAGLWAAGALLSAALRAAYLAGALPTLGAALAGDPEPRQFATGLAFRFPRVAATALLAFLLDLGGLLVGAAAALGTVLVSARAPASPSPGLAAFLGAGAITAALLLPFALTTLGDAAVARAAIRDDPPFQALVRATRRFLERPGAFLLAMLAVGAFGTALAASGQSLFALVTGFAAREPAWLLLGPQLMAGSLTALLAAWVDLWRLGAVAGLACHAEPA